MAIDPNAPTSTTNPGPAPVIENEIPAYRAISALAVTSLVLGSVSLLAFADLRFLLVAGVAIAAGLLGLRKIRRYPDILTGAGMARVGIALGAVFAASSITSDVAAGLLLDRSAGQFARQYIDVLKDQPIAAAIWYQQPPELRKTKQPDELVEDMKKNSKSPSGGDAFAERTAALRKLKDRIKGQGEKINYSKIESKYVDGLTHYVNVLIDLDGPGSEQFPEKEEFALFELVKANGGGAGDYVVKEIKYPYKPASVVAAPVHKDDDGHGH